MLRGRCIGMDRTLFSRAGVLLIALAAGAPALATPALPPTGTPGPDPAAPAVNDENQDQDEDEAKATASAPAGEVRPAKFHNLRFEEDWTWLGETEDTSNHAFPGAKYMDLGDGWSLGIGGQVRYRYMNEKNKSRVEASPQQNDFHLWRTRVHADLRHDSGWRFFVEALDARIHSNSRPPLGIDANNVDLQSGFVEYDSGDVMARVGRMELQEGAQRLISPLDWGNTRRKFEGGLVRVKGSNSTTDVFLTRPVPILRRDKDTRDSSRWFSGVYHSRKLQGGDTLDVFGLKLNEKDSLFGSEKGGKGDLDLYTVGVRLAGKSEQTDYELWYAQQFGDQGGDDIDAFAASASVGHKLPDAPGKPRIGLDVDYASGDDDPTDGDKETFNQLFPLGHKYFGFLDLIGRRNIVDLSPNVLFTLNKRTKLRAAFHYFRLAQKEDAIYTAGGAATFADPTGTAGSNVGEEIDITLVHSPEFLGPHGKVVLGWSHFMPGRRIDSLGGNGDTDLFFVQLAYTF